MHFHHKQRPLLQCLQTNPSVLFEKSTYAKYPSQRKAPEEHKDIHRCSRQTDRRTNERNRELNACERVRRSNGSTLNYLPERGFGVGGT